HNRRTTTTARPSALLPFCLSTISQPVTSTCSPPPLHLTLSPCSPSSSSFPFPSPRAKSQSRSLGLTAPRRQAFGPFSCSSPLTSNTRVVFAPSLPSSSNHPPDAGTVLPSLPPSFPLKRRPRSASSSQGNRAIKSTKAPARAAKR